ncbi:SGNH hydrolase-type esterase domain-containing protein [Paraphoma chrysanthemicola]|uniref:SGNH hydrolase-type esterase domain-containing protein n=1 Tax=Paraphoma chrysanthemicola TaxID=798071 RepID=A0A8K0VZF4_9PLEO|nr:SGNH hydrolase-type esterase domain-containing protein [Paraphoma chrysanthemicola]
MSSSTPLPEFILFGDSLTEWGFDPTTLGYGHHLEKMYAGKARVVNEGQAGYTTTSLASDFARIIDRATSPSAAPTLLFTILLGANDACIIGETEYVPWHTFSANIRNFLETILTQDAMSETKIVLITPPPINVPEGLMDEGDEGAIEDANKWKREGPRYKTYMSKKRYAEGLMEIANEYAETGRVIGVDFWKGCVEEKISEDGGTWEEVEESGMWPGCGLVGAKMFEKGWFWDGLHLDVKGYAVLNRIVVEEVVRKWPELAAERM